VLVEVAGRKQRAVVDGGEGFASQNDRRPHFGLGQNDHVDRVTIRWPSGTKQVLTALPADQFHVVREPKR